MSYIEKNLAPRERLIYLTQLHWIIFFFPAVITVAILVFIYYKPEMRLANLVGVVLIVYLYLATAIRYISCEYGISTERVLMKEGFIRVRTFDTVLSRVESVELQQSLLGRIIGYGDVIVCGTGGDKTVFATISDPAAFRTKLMSVMNEAAE